MKKAGGVLVVVVLGMVGEPTFSQEGVPVALETVFHAGTRSEIERLPEHVRDLEVDCPKNTSVTQGMLARISERWGTTLRSLTLKKGVTDRDRGGIGVTDRDLEGIGAIPSLEVLKLILCDQLDGTGLQHLRGLPKLRELALIACRNIKKAHLPLLGELKTLDTLAFTDCLAVTDESLKTIAALPRLRSLDLKRNMGLRGPGLAHLAAATLLDTLDLDYCENLGIENLECLRTMTPLRVLRLDNTGVHCSALTYSNVPDVPSTVTAPIFRYIASLKNLEEFSINCNFMDEEASWNALAGLTKLTSLSIRSLARIDPLHFAKLKSLKGLETLDLFAGFGIGDACLETIGTFAHLRELKLLKSPCSQAGLQHLRHLQNLEELWVSWAPHITAFSLDMFSTMTGLKKLNLRGNVDISENDVKRLRRQMPRTEILYEPGMVEKHWIERTEKLSVLIEAISEESDPAVGSPRSADTAYTARSREDLGQIPEGITHLNVSLPGDEVTRPDIEQIAVRCGPSLQSLSVNPREPVVLDSEAGLTRFQEEMNRLKGKNRVAVRPRCRVTGEALSALATLPRLERLELHACDGVTDDTLEIIAKLKQLRSLDLSGCLDLKGQGLVHLKALKSLTALALNHIPEFEIAHLGSLHGMTLRSLELMDTGMDCRAITYGDRNIVSGDITARIFEHIAPLKGSLESFAIDTNLMDEKSWDMLAGFTRLKSLTLRNLVEVDAIQFSKLRALRDLERLILAGGAGLHDGCLATIASFSHLQHLDMREAACTYHGLKHLASLKKLETLDLSCSGLIGTDLEAIYPITSLRRVVLYNDLNLYDYDMEALIKHFPDTKIVFWQQ